MKKTIISLVAGVTLSALAAAQGVVAPYAQNFDSIPGQPFNMAVGVGTTGIGAEWDYATSGASAAFCRSQILPVATIGAIPVPPTTLGNGPSVMRLDLNPSQTPTGVNTVVLHINGSASDLGSGYRIRILLREVGDEVHAGDVIAFQDGSTMGNGVTNTGASTGLPGYGGFQEVRLLDWNAAGIGTNWVEFTFNIDAAFLATNGLVSGMDHRLIIRQEDNFPTISDGLLVDLVRVDSNVPDDVGVTAITAPISSLSCVPLSNSESVTITVFNNGSATRMAGSMIPASYSVNGGPAVMENLVLGANLAPGASTSLTFATGADLSTQGIYTLSATTMLPGDPNTLNDTLAGYVVQSGSPIINTFPYTENFDATVWNGTGNGSVIPPTDWKQDLTEAVGTDSDWYFRNTDTPSVNTGPVADHTTGVAGVGYYAYVEDSTGNFAAVNLLSPCFDLSGLSNPNAIFWYQSNNGNNPTTTFENFLHVDVISYTTNTTTLDVIPPIGHVDLNWHQAFVNLGAFVGQVVEVRIRGTSNGGSFTHDLAIDDFSLVDLVTGIGQAPQSGLAVLNINDCVDANGFPLSSGANGPYFASAMAGGPMLFTISGVANQPIILLTGPLNPAVAAFPGIGQIDIGTMNPTPPFIPGNIIILADGTTGTGFLGSFFVTDGAGNMNIGLSSGALPMGLFATFQAAVFNGGPGVVSLSNAVQVSIL